MSDEREHEDPVGNALRGVPAVGNALRGIPASPLEQSLASFAPAPAQLDRDRLMFLAGQASVPECGPLAPRGGNHSRHWLWPASTATLAATSLALAIALFTR